jgi:ABC-2 type transport system permease protein
MTWRDVVRRDLLSVYRSRVGTAVTAVLALSTVVAAGFFALVPNVGVLGPVGGLLTLVVLLGLVFLGSPRSIAAVVGLFTALALGLALALAPETPANGEFRPPMRLAVQAVGGGLSFLLPLVALLGSYGALVGERASGSVRFLLGLPNSRADAYVGKYVSRALVVCVPLVVGLALTGLIVQVTFEDGSMLGVLGVAAVSVPYGLLFVGIGLTASSYADTPTRAVAVVVSAFTILRAGWPAVQWLGLQGVRDPYPRPEWFFWIGRLNPINAYVKLTTLFADFEYGHPLLTQADDVVVPVATSHWFAAVVLLAWTVLAPVAGLLYFDERDLL